MKSNLFNVMRVVYTLIMVSLFFFSCSKEGNSDSEDIGNNRVSFTVSGISDPDEVGNMASLAKHVSSKISVEKEDNIIWEMTSMDVNQRNGLSVNQNQSTDIELKNKATNKAATSAVEIGVKYRVLIYEYAGGVIGNFRENKQIAVGSAGEVILSPNKSYYYIAYSYNSSDDVAPVTDTNNPIIKSKTNAPLLYASGNFTLDGSDENIQIIFRHQVSQVQVLVDVTPMTANIISLVANFQNMSLSTQDFNLKTGQLIAGTTLSETVNSALVFGDFIPNDASVKMSRNEYYTVDRNPNVIVAFTTFTVDRGGQANENILTGSDNVVSMNNFSNTITGIKRARIVVDKRGTVISGIEWATGNLYYDATAGKRYKIASEVTSFANGTHEGCNYYWNFNSLLPRSETGDAHGPIESNVSNDPCKLIAGGQWRLPYIGEFGVLFNEAVATAGNSSGANTIYVEAKTGGKRIYFHKAGYVRSGGNGCVFDSQASKLGRYRANDIQSDKFGYYYAVEKSTGLKPDVNIIMSTDALANHETVVELRNLVTGSNIDKGFSIRCIRNYVP